MRSIKNPRTERAADWLAPALGLALCCAAWATNTRAEEPMGDEPGMEEGGPPPEGEGGADDKGERRKERMERRIRMQEQRLAMDKLRLRYSEASDAEKPKVVEEAKGVIAKQLDQAKDELKKTIEKMQTKLKELDQKRSEQVAKAEEMLKGQGMGRRSGGRRGPPPR